MYSVYRIYLDNPENCYVGITSQFKRRINDHKSALSRGDHYSIKLQGEYNSMKSPKLKYEKLYGGITKENKDQAESYFIHLHNCIDNEYNIADPLLPNRHTLSEYLIYDFNTCEIYNMVGRRNVRRFLGLSTKNMRNFWKTKLIKKRYIIGKNKKHLQKRLSSLRSNFNYIYLYDKEGNMVDVKIDRSFPYTIKEDKEITYGGLRLRYSKEDNIGKYIEKRGHHPNSRTSVAVQYWDKEGNLIGEINEIKRCNKMFSSSKAAAKVGNRSRGYAVSKAGNKRDCRYYRGYFWNRKGDGVDMPKYIKNYVFEKYEK